LAARQATDVGSSQSGAAARQPQGLGVHDVVRAATPRRYRFAQSGRTSTASPLQQWGMGEQAEAKQG